LKHIQNKAVSFANNTIEFRVHQSGEHNGLNTIFIKRLVDVADGLMSLINAIHKWDTDVLKSGLKLSQNRLAEVLGGDAGSVRNNKNYAGFGRHGFGLKVRVSTTIGIIEVCPI
jgi:hypothetical protein